ncbi:Diuretic hormone class 2 [Amphibalanus amphitrite]|uniref:Diuretic hormone class 2 n=1 Tax=Amphibalanus amphitrite TaxID=1232801 RepID=A0A6A4V4X5_AMPAM|nr:Diuretic hormone class 2 [Amphibalanus amphitrite]
MFRFLRLQVEEVGDRVWFRRRGTCQDPISTPSRPRTGKQASWRNGPLDTGRIMCRSALLSGGVTVFLVALVLCTLSLCSAASLQVNDGLERKPWMDAVQRELPSDAYMTEFIARLRALKDAEDIGLAQYDIIDSYFREHVPFLHLVSPVPNSGRQAQQEAQPGKRGLDFGLGRGFSGSQAAKHMMGLAAANFAGGPGRRRRSAPLPTLH